MKYCKEKDNKKVVIIINNTKCYLPIAKRVFNFGFAFFSLCTLSYSPTFPSLVSSLLSKEDIFPFFSHPKAKMMCVHRSGKISSGVNLPTLTLKTKIIK